MKVVNETIFRLFLGAVLTWMALFLVYITNAGQSPEIAAVTALSLAVGGSGLAWILWVVVSVTIAIITRKTPESATRNIVTYVVPVIAASINVLIAVMMVNGTGGQGLSDLFIPIAIISSVAFAGAAVVAVGLSRILFRWLNSR
ncbi:MAG: hypothetical protein ACKOWP_03170 [Microbacteriaceae bacterium]